VSDMGTLQLYMMEPLWETADLGSDDDDDTVDGNSDRPDSIEQHQMDQVAEEHGVTLPIQLADGRMDTPEKSSFLSIYPVPGDSQMFYIRLKTSHYSFSIKKSCVTRSCSSFYELRSILKSHHPQLTIPSLPMQPSLWVYSYNTISLSLATFLAGVMAERQLLSNKALHLFLQTQLSIEKIIENMEGKRDDEVVVAKCKIVKDDRNNAKEGFGGLFGSVNN